MKTTVLIKLDMKDPDLARIREVARGSREGKIVAFPTETVYGMGAPMSIRSLHETLVQIKRRDDNKPFSYHIGDWDMLDMLGVKPTPSFRYLSRLFWPGPLTLLVHNREGKKIGIRFPKHRLTAALINAVGEPFIATSANLSGAPSSKTADEVMNQLGGQIDYLIDGGKCELGEDSTISDLTGDDPVIVRKGAFNQKVSEAIDKIKSGNFPRKKILVVCTGNSCRSPMAAGWLQDQLAAKGLKDKIEVLSCGIHARSGMPATPEAIYVMKNREIDISGHISQTATRRDILEADLILCMSQEHAAFILGMVQGSREKIRVLEIPDPIGMSMAVYEQVGTMIDKKMKDLWNDIVA